MNETTRTLAGSLALAAGALVGCSTSPEPAPDPVGTTEARIEPRADELLRALSARLTASPQMSFQADITYEELEPVEDASARTARIQYGGQVRFVVSRPSMLRVSYSGDRERRDFFVDGRAATMLAPDENVYSSIEAMETIEATLDAMWEKIGVTPPLADLVYRDPYSRLAPNVVASRYVGLHDVDGAPCHHLSLTQANSHWQIWIAAEGDPLPRKMSMTEGSDPGAPVFTAEFGGWNFDATASPDAFLFTPPEGAIEVEAIVTPYGVADAGGDR